MRRRRRQCGESLECKPRGRKDLCLAWLWLREKAAYRLADLESTP